MQRYFALFGSPIKSPRSTMMIAIALFIILGMLTPGPAAGFRISKPCCTRYSDKAVAFKHIRGYREQNSLEHCRINAIIFYTTSNHEVCARPEDEWVKKALDSLSKTEDDVQEHRG